MGILGNQKADAAAKSALSLPVTRMNLFGTVAGTGGIQPPGLPCSAPDRVLRHRAKKNDRHIDKLLLTHTIYAFTLTVRSEISNTQRKKFAYSYM